MRVFYPARPVAALGLAFLSLAVLLAGPGTPEARAQLVQVSAGGPYTGQPGQALIMTAQTVPALTFATYQWNFGDGTTGTGQSTIKTYNAAGTYSVTVTVSAPTGHSGSATTTAQIGSGGTATFQISAGGPYTGQPGQPVTMLAQPLVGSGQTGVLNYQWTFGDGTSGIGQTTSHAYTTAGTYTVTVRATNATGQQATATTTAQIGGSGQTGTGQVSAGGPYTGQPGVPISLIAQPLSAALQTGGSVQYVWNFGDGTSGTGQTVTHTYTTAGSYSVTVTATTALGTTASATTSAAIGSTSSATTPATGATEQVQLFATCNNVALTWPNGTALSTVAAAISPSGSLRAIWKFDNTNQRFSAYSPIAGAPNDLTSINRADPVFVCMDAAGSLTRPVI